MPLIAKVVTKNKFWIVEKDGKKIATIQSTPGGVTLVQNETREQFVSINLLKNKYNIVFDNPRAAKTPAISSSVNGFPCDHIPFNAMTHLTKKLPVYTKTKKSKSFYCAGYYLIQFSLGFVYAYCPKLITLNRYKFHGPFLTKTASREFYKKLKEPNNE